MRLLVDSKGHEYNATISNSYATGIMLVADELFGKVIKTRISL